MAENKKNLSARELVPSELRPQGHSEEFIANLVLALESVPKHLSGTPIVTVVSEFQRDGDCVFWVVPGDWENDDSTQEWPQLTHRIKLCGPVSTSTMTRLSWVITKAFDHMGLVVHTARVDQL